jgi:hypothetical protein
MRTTLAALVFLLALMSAGKSQDDAEDMTQIYAVFDCAAIAFHAVYPAEQTSDESRWTQEYDRLFAFGYSKARAGYARVWDTIMKDPHAALWVKLRVGPEFIVGITWEERDKYIEKIRHDEVVKRAAAATEAGNSTTSLIKDTERAVLEDMFRERNCHLIGR